MDQRKIVVKNTDDPLIYATERISPDAYHFKVPNGVYTVRLHYMEGWKVRPENPATDAAVLINGKEKVKPFNLGLEAGGKDRALIKTIDDIKVDDGKIIITWAKNGEGGSRINGIEVIRKK